jgi:hypothetical protein
MATSLHGRHWHNWRGKGQSESNLELVRTYLQESLKPRMKKADLFVFDTCLNWIRTVPVLQRSGKDMEDVDS